MGTFRDLLHRKVVVLHQEATVLQAARAMSDNGVGCIVVSDHEGHIIGIVTDRDLACNALAFSMGNQITISEVMTKNPIYVEENSNLQEIVNLMIKNGIRRIPVIRKQSEIQQKCVGLVAFDDLVASQLLNVEQLAEIVQSQVRRLRNRFINIASNTRIKYDSESYAAKASEKFYEIIMSFTQLDRLLAEQVSILILSSTIQRLHYSASVRLISQLPEQLKNDLLEFPSGPDRRVTLQKLRTELELRFGFNEVTSQSIIRNFCSALQSLLGSSEFEHIKSQLPEEFRSLFPKFELPIRKTA